MFVCSANNIMKETKNLVKKIVLFKEFFRNGESPFLKGVSLKESFQKGVLFEEFFQNTESPFQKGVPSKDSFRNSKTP